MEPLNFMVEVMFDLGLNEYDYLIKQVGSEYFRHRGKKVIRKYLEL